MRVYFLWLAIVILFGTGFRHWFYPFCGLVILSAFMQRHDMPTNIMGITGANPWNILLAIVFFHWFLQRVAEGRRWDLGGWPLFILAAYMFMIFVGFVRAVVDIESFAPNSMSTGNVRRVNYTVLGLFVDELVNPVRYLLPAFLLYDGCRTRTQVKYAIAAIVAMGFSYAVFVVKYIPLGTLLGTDYVLKSRNRIDREIGLHANDMAYVLVFVFWATVACWPLIKKWSYRVTALGVLTVLALGTALCQSRAGFLTFIAIGGVLAALRKPILVPVFIIGIMIIPIAMPGIADRMGMGFGQNDGTGESGADWDEITAGRLTNLWPVAIEYIAKSPVLGYGRYAMLRDRHLFHDILEAEGSVPTHPHNAYLEVLLDYGGIGLAVVLTLFSSLLYIAFKQMRDQDDVLCRVVGTIAFIAGFQNMVIGMSSRALLPRPSAMSMWCAFAISVRFWMERKKARQVQTWQYATPQLAYG